MSKSSWTIVFALFAASNLANAAWMLAAPAHWYLNLPANVPGTGPLNEHFVRDIGCIYLMVGVAAALAAARESWRRPALVLGTAWYVLHALVHVIDQLRGLWPAEQWRLDLVGIYVPAVFLAALLAAFERGADAA